MARLTDIEVEVDRTVRFALDTLGTQSKKTGSTRLSRRSMDAAHPLRILRNRGRCAGMTRTPGEDEDDVEIVQTDDDVADPDELFCQILLNNITTEVIEE